MKLLLQHKVLRVTVLSNIRHTSV